MLTRRSLLSRLSAAPLALSAGGGATSAMVSNIAAHAANTTGYKALVCVFLRGGMDCHDTLMPKDQSSYQRYGELRSELFNAYAQVEGTSSTNTSRARNNTLELDPVNASAFGSRAFALPPQMPNIHRLFEQGDASIVANVGPLIQPTTNTEYQNGVAIPPRLFSHNDQQSVWASSTPEGAQFGWGGMFADAMINANANVDPLYSAISYSGKDVFLNGELARQFEVGTGGAALFRELTRTTYLNASSNKATSEALLDEILRAQTTQRDNLFERDIVTAINRSIDSNASLNALLEAAPTLQTSFPVSDLGKQLAAAAKMISIRGAAGAARQVFLTSTGGFDTHSDQHDKLPDLQTNLDNSIAAFHNAMIELGTEQDVLLFTVADFGRTLTVNGAGTDHAWGGHHFVVGGGIQGRRIFGDPAPFDTDHNLDIGRGRMIPTTSVSQYAGALGRWFGLSDSELALALPGLSAFSEGPIGLV